jgi:hypothetical protein
MKNNLQINQLITLVVINPVIFNELPSSWWSPEIRLHLLLHAHITWARVRKTIIATLHDEVTRAHAVEQAGLDKG